MRRLSSQYIVFVALLIFITSTRSQQVLTNLPFDCKGRLDGFWRDGRYCDVFHACVAGVQKRSYGCPQVGERFYFDDTTQKCEFASENANGCSANQYYGAISSPSPVPGGQISTLAPSEPWKVFAQSREQFTCAGKADGFYASRWCNVFYRCFSGISNAFLCPLQRGGGRLWWIQHGSSQSVSEDLAQCTYPCDTGRRCSSPGGVLVDNGNQISESQQDAETAFQRSPCSNQTNTLQVGSGGNQPSISSGISNPNPSTGNQNQFVQPPTSVVGCGNACGTGSGNQGTSTNTGGGSFQVDSDVNCNNQANDAYLASRYCNVFHRCVGGTRVDLRCARANNASQDLWWNQETKLCDWPCRVECNNQIFGSSMTAQQIRSESLLFFNNNCRAYPRIFKRNK